MGRDYMLFMCGMLATAGGVIADVGHEFVGVSISVAACCMATFISLKIGEARR